MSSYYYGSGQQQQSQHHGGHSNQHHGGGSGRSRRATRAAAHHNHSHNQHQKQMRALRLQQKEAEESALEKACASRKDFDAARSFEYEDDELFCPMNLLTDDDLQSMHSGSDRSSLSSGSPEHSPLQQQIQPTPAFLLPPSSTGYPVPAEQSTPQSSKAHQSMVNRAARAIPIVDPTTRNVASPPLSVSPARQLMQPPPQFITVGGGNRRW
jgi:hypothetical protein